MKIKIKQIATLAFLLMFCIMQNIEAQTYTPRTSVGGGIDITQKEETTQTFVCKGTSFKIYRYKTGSLYVVGVSVKTEKEYPIWIHKPTSDKFEGETVYKTKEGNYCIYKLSKTGYPYPVWLTRN